MTKVALPVLTCKAAHNDNVIFATRSWFGRIWKAELMGLIGGSDVGCERMKKLRMALRLSSWAITRMGVTY